MGEKIILVVFGWLLGLLAPVIHSLILAKRKSEVIKRGMKSELTEQKHRLVLSAYLFAMDYGKFDHEFLSWVKEQLENYRGVNRKESFEKQVADLLALDSNQLAAVVHGQRDASKGKSAKYARIPFLESQLSELGNFDAPTQTIVLEIVEHIRIYNETVEDAKRNFERTFDATIIGRNREMLEANLNANYKQLAERSRIIAGRIDDFLER